MCASRARLGIITSTFVCGFGTVAQSRVDAAMGRPVLMMGEAHPVFCVSTNRCVVTALTTRSVSRPAKRNCNVTHRLVLGIPRIQLYTPLPTHVVDVRHVSL